MVKEELGMKASHRELIRRNLDRLVDLTNYDELMDECVRTRLLTERMRDIIERLKNSQDELDSYQLRVERHRDLLLKITKRGPDAFYLFKDILKTLNCLDAINTLEQVNSEAENRERVWNPSSRNSLSRIVAQVSTSTSTITSKSKSLRKSVSITSNGNGNCPNLEPRSINIIPKVVREVIKSDRLHNDAVIGSYAMRTKDKRGILFLVNIIDFRDPDVKRNAAEEDALSLEDLFTQIGFKVFSYTNLSGSHFFQLLRTLLDSDYTRGIECFVLSLMTHGNRVQGRDFVEFHDGAIIPTFDILDYFRNECSPNLIDKPKVLLFPFCRGETPDFGFKLRNLKQNMSNQSASAANTAAASAETDSIRTATAAGTVQNIATMSDIIICYASVPGFQTHRDPVYGSWYVQKFCDVMAQHAHNTNFQDILIMTQKLTGHMRTMKGSLQTACYEAIHFNKRLYFNPGFWEIKE